MRRRALLMAVLLALPLSSGCVLGAERVGAVEEPFSPPLGRLHQFTEANVTITASDGVLLQATLYQPRPFAATDRFPAVVFVHGWGGSRGAPDDPRVDVMRSFAAHGHSVLAYDVRGFGESGGSSTLAGPREMQDLHEVIDWHVNATPWNGHVGVTGHSYGGAHALWALVHDDRVTTAVPHYGWVDLADGLAPGGVPKQWWIATLLFIGTFGGGRYDPVIYEWLQAAATREDFEPVLDALRARSTAAHLAEVRKPVFFVEGTDETLFPHALDGYALASSSAERKVFFFHGGHGTFSAEAWEATRLWFDHHLKRVDSGVDAWPALTLTAPWSGARETFDAYPLAGTEAHVYHLVDDASVPGQGRLSNAPGPEASARYSGSGRSGALDDPSVVVDATGLRPPGTPSALRALPGESVLFRSDPFASPALLVGPGLLNVTLDGLPTGFQLAARLYVEDAMGVARLVSRGAVDPRAEGLVAVELALSRALARIEAGERLVLVLAGDDAAHTAPYPRPFTAEARFGGATEARLVLPVTPTA